MGGICVPAEQHDQRIDQLEELLREQAEEKKKLHKRLQEEKRKQEKLTKKKKDEEDKEKIEKLTNEKKQVFKTMLKERKNVQKLRDDIDEYKIQINDMEEKMENLRHEKNKAQQRATNAEKKQATLKKMKSEKEKEEKEREEKLNKKRRSSIIKTMQKNTPVFINKISNKICKTPEPPPFRVKPKTPQQSLRLTSNSNDSQILSSEDEGSLLSNDSSIEDSLIDRKTTESLDEQLDPRMEATHVYSWLHACKVDSKKEKKQLKTRLASLFTSRSEGYRSKLKSAYNEQYGRDLEKDIKAILNKSHAMEIVHALLMTSADLDSDVLFKNMSNWDIESCADIVCCRTIEQLRTLNEAYKKKHKQSIKGQLQALAQRDKKKTLVKVIENIFDPDRKESINVDMNQVNADLNFVLTNKKFKNDAKERLIVLFTGSSVQFIKVLNQQFKLKSKDSLTTFIDKKLGKRSIAGHYCKVRIEYALDSSLYFANKIKTLGSNYKKNQNEIARLFVQRMEIDLQEIAHTWTMKKFGENDRALKEWVKWKTSNSKSGYFLQKMLDNCGRYATFNKNIGNPGGKRKSKFEQMMM